ncbi:MAG: IS3 family transposase [Patescibacteria group bacterium]|nr:IS3 family transposase [Patescibacteria group bacterium]
MSILCDLAQVSRCGYYKWLQHADEPDKDYADYLTIKKVFDGSKGKFGWRSIKMALPAMNHKKIQRIMRKYSLIAKVRRRNPYRDAKKKTMENRICPNLLQREFNQIIPFKAFCTDITYIRFLQGFAYISAIKDVASGEVVAWNVSLYIDMSLVTETIRRMPQESHENALIHSDQGFQYTSPSYIEIVKEMGMIQSMSEKGKCLDNAPIESFWGHMKDELDYESCETFGELSLKVDEYMRYYNYERRQWTRNKMTPVEYRNHLLSKETGVRCF